MWASVSAERDSSDIEAQEENVAFIKDEKGKTLLRELTYNGKRNKVSQGPISKVKVKKELLSSIIKDLEENVSVRTWIENAAQRFLSLPNPLKQLFETHGLQVLSGLYDNREDSLVQAASDNRLTCSRGSWAYRKLGSMIYKKLYDFVPSNECLTWVNSLIPKRKDNHRPKNQEIEANYSSNWERISHSKVYLELWRNNFEMKDRTPMTSSGVARVIEEEMRRWLRGLTLDIQNVSTYAVEDLLDCNLYRKADLRTRIKVKFSKMNRVTLKSLSKEELIKKGKKIELNLRKEFRRQFGKRIDELSIMPPS